LTCNFSRMGGGAGKGGQKARPSSFATHLVARIQLKKSKNKKPKSFARRRGQTPWKAGRWHGWIEGGRNAWWEWPPEYTKAGVGKKVSGETEGTGTNKKKRERRPPLSLLQDHEKKERGSPDEATCFDQGQRLVTERGAGLRHGE